MLGTLQWFSLVAAFSELDVNNIIAQPKFEVRIATEPIEPSVPMLIHGKPHKCHVPPSDHWAVRESAIEPTQSQINEAALVIGGLKNCTFIADGYWGYKLCHNRDIWQIHPEIEGGTYVFKENSPTIFLGRISDEHPSVELRDNSWQLKVKYAHGDVCDLTGEPRKTTFFYVCDETASRETIQDYSEVHICTYEFTIGTNKICDLFKPAREPVNFIRCYEEPSDQPKEAEAPVEQHQLEETAQESAPQGSVQSPSAGAVQESGEEDLSREAPQGSQEHEDL